MLKAILTTGALIALGATSALAQTSGTTTGGANAKMTSAECQSVWNKAAGSGASGTLTQTQAQAYVQDFKRADANSDGSLSNAEFTTACQNGMVKDTASTGSGSGSTSTGSGTTGGSSTKN